MSALSIADRVIRQAVAARLADIRKLDIAALRAQVADVAALRIENARLRREATGWSEIAQQAQQRITKLEEQLARALSETRTT